MGFVQSPSHERGTRRLDGRRADVDDVSFHDDGGGGVGSIGVDLGGIIRAECEGFGIRWSATRTTEQASEWGVHPRAEIGVVGGNRRGPPTGDPNAREGAASLHRTNDVTDPSSLYPEKQR